MSDPKPEPFEASVESDSRKAPVRVAFVTRRTSPQVKAEDDQYVMTWPEGIFRIAVVCEVLAIVLVLMALFWDAPLEGLADPMQTPNPAKAPWYFLGLQELLHYFPPVVGGVLIPTLVVLALIVIPYFNVNIEAAGLWSRDRRKRLQIFSLVALAMIALLIAFQVWAVLAPTVLIGAVMLSATRESSTAGRFQRWLTSRPLSFWIMTWFLVTATLLTAIGTFFRGPGWAWVWPWNA
jgi:quinol---cytochrome c reductase cytochrome c subunit, bacillus type